MKCASFFTFTFKLDGTILFEEQLAKSSVTVVIRLSFDDFTVVLKAGHHRRRKEGHQCDQYIGSIMLALHPLLSAVSQRIIAALIRAALDHDTNRLEMHERYNFETLNSSYSD